MAQTPPVEKVLPIIYLLTDGGYFGQIIMISLFIMLFGALYIYFERLLKIKNASKIDTDFMDRIRLYVRKGKIVDAQNFCAQNDASIARLIEKGISKIGKPIEDINISIENTGKIEIYKIEKNISILATIAGIAPMTGFLSAFSGIILAFQKIEATKTQIEIAIFSQEIYGSLMGIAVGLIIGIVAYIGYNHLVAKINAMIHQMEILTEEFLDLLNDPA